VIRVLIVDDHSVVRQGLENMLASSDRVTVVGTADGGREAVEKTRELMPDVVLMDMQMPEVDGVEATRRITEAFPRVRVVILTAFSDRERILGALDAGAAGYLLKDSESEDLVRGIEAAARGEAPLAPKAAQVVLTSRTARSSTSDLTQRERDVLGLLVRGMPNKQIATELEISEKTVKAHLSSAFRRIGVTDRTQAALWAERNGIVGDTPIQQ
jgi:DNA-binding NarL/FixJ family response regulator